MHWNFKKGRLYFVLDPEGNGISYFETIEERDDYAQECIQQYLDGAWSEEVVNVVAGVVTHSAQETDREERPDELDDEDCDDGGIYWEPDCDYRCNYKLLPVDA